MEGKTIVKVLELGDGVVLMKMDDDTFVSAKIIDPEIAAEEIEEFLGAAKPGKKEVKEEKKPEKKETPSDDELTWDEISEMGLKALKKVIDDKTLITDADDFQDDLPGLRKSIAKELDLEIPGKKEEKKKEPEPDSSDYTWADLVAMDFDELSDLCKENKADTDPADFDEDTEDAFRRAIAKEFDITAPPKKK